MAERAGKYGEGVATSPMPLGVASLEMAGAASL